MLGDCADAIPFFPDTTIQDIFEPTSLVKPKRLLDAPNERPNRLLGPVETAIEATCRTFAVRRHELLSHSKTSKYLTKVRRVACYVARFGTCASFPELGRAFCRDHSTIMTAVTVAQQMIDADPELKDTVERLIAEVRGA